MSLALDEDAEHDKRHTDLVKIARLIGYENELYSFLFADQIDVAKFERWKHHLSASDTMSPIGQAMVFYGDLASVTPKPEKYDITVPGGKLTEEQIYGFA